MKQQLSIELNELNKVELSLNAYLALLMIKYGDIKYIVRDEDLNELKNGNWIIGNILTEKADKYFDISDLFEVFYTTFPHTVPNQLGEERPLRNESSNTEGAKLTYSLWKSKTRGNKEKQKEIIEVLIAEIEWRKNTNNLMYMNNINTWLRQHNWEKYKYLLQHVGDKNIYSKIKRI